MEEILERQLLIQGRAFATFSTIEKALAGIKVSFRGQHVVLACYKRMSAKNWSEWRWAFSLYGVENWLLLRIMRGTKCLNPFFRLHKVSEVLNKYVVGVWPDNFTVAFSVSFIVTVFVPDIEEIQNKAICLWIGTTCSVNVTSTRSANLYDISRRKPSSRAPNFKKPRVPKMKIRLCMHDSKSFLVYHVETCLCHVH